MLLAFFFSFLFFHWKLGLDLMPPSRSPALYARSMLVYYSRFFQDQLPTSLDLMKRLLINWLHTTTQPSFQTAKSGQKHSFFSSKISFFDTNLPLEVVRNNLVMEQLFLTSRQNKCAFPTTCFRWILLQK